MIVHLLLCNNSISNLNLNLLYNSNCTYLITRRHSNCHKLDQKEFTKRINNCHFEIGVHSSGGRVNKQIVLLLEPNYMPAPAPRPASAVQKQQISLQSVR